MRRTTDLDRDSITDFRPGADTKGRQMIDKNDLRARARKVGGKLKARAESKTRLRIEFFRTMCEATGRRWPWGDDYSKLELVDRPPSVGASLAARQRGKPTPATFVVLRERQM